MTSVLIVVGALLLGLVVHELGHAAVMRRFGAPVVAAGLGLPLFPVLRVTVRPGFQLTLSPWLVGAYVTTDAPGRGRLQALPYRDEAWYLNAGVVSNLAFGFALWGVADLAEGSLRRVAIHGACGLTVVLGRRWIAAYLLPAIAVPVLALVVYAQIRAVTEAHSMTGLGMIGLVDLVPGAGVEVVAFFGTVSMALGLLNTAPLFPLDNGRVVARILTQWWGAWVATAFQLAGTGLVLIALVTGLVSDVLAVIE